jgi:hypothetical protein
MYITLLLTITHLTCFILGIIVTHIIEKKFK